MQCKKSATQLIELKLSLVIDIKLKLLEVRFWDLFVGQQAESGVDAIDGLALLH